MSRSKSWFVRRSPWLLALGLVAGGLCGLGAAGQEPGDPEKPQVGVRARVGDAYAGKVSFKMYCRSCHGDEGHGDGPVAEYLKVAPSDLTLLAQRHGGEFPYEEVFHDIDGRKRRGAHGGSEMPVWGNAFHQLEEGPGAEDRVEQKVEELVQYLLSIQRQDESQPDPPV